MVRSAIYLIAIAIVANPTIFANPVYQKGMSYTPWGKNVLYRPESAESIRTMQKDGVNWVALNVFWFQDTVNSAVITEDFTRYSASKPSLIQAIQDIHSAGMKVMLKPMVDVRTGDWRGEIVPSPEWFDAYESFVADWAAFAAQNHADMFCVGCEYINATQSRRWEPYWRRIIAHVRTAFPGPLTYADNHDNEQNTPWWDAVDYIGIDAYYVLTQKLNPTATDLKAAWKARADRIELWRNRNWPQMPIIFTEIGYRSYDGANIAPWDYQKNDPDKVDLQEQVDCYTAALETLTQRDWFYGFYWWAWETDPNAGGAKDSGYTVQNKPAETVLKDWYLHRLVRGRFTPAGVGGFEWYR